MAEPQLSTRPTPAPSLSPEPIRLDLSLAAPRVRVPRSATLRPEEYEGIVAASRWR